MKRVFGILLLLVVCALAFFWWKGRVRDKNLNDGEVACDGCMSPERQAAFLKENAGEDAEGQSEHKSTRHNEMLEDKGVKTTTTVATTTAPATTVATPVAATTTTTTVGTTTYPAATTTSSTTTPVTAPVTYSGPTTPVATTTSISTTSAKTPAGAPPTYDTIAPNAPNGSIFTGSGAYQWYRQGNLTWRVDSRTGRSCIVFATDEEWRKERVMSHGCGKSA